MCLLGPPSAGPLEAGLSGAQVLGLFQGPRLAQVASGGCCPGVLSATGAPEMPRAAAPVQGAWGRFQVTQEGMSLGSCIWCRPVGLALPPQHWGSHMSPPIFVVCLHLCPWKLVLLCVFFVRVIL